MPDRYWVGGTGTWNGTNTTNWSATTGGAGGASVPTTADNVFIDANSGTGTITIAANVNCANLGCNGYTGTLAGDGSIRTITVAGTVLRFASGMTLTLGNTSTQLSLTNAGTVTITSAGKTLWRINASGNVTLADALTTTSAATTGLALNGNLTTGSNNFTGKTLNIQGTGASSLGTSTITVDQFLFWNGSGMSSATFNVAQTIQAVTTSGNGTHSLGPTTLSLTTTAPDGYIGCNTGSTIPAYSISFSSLTINGAANTTSNVRLEFASGRSLTVTGAFTVAGNNTAPNRLLVRSATLGTAMTVTPSGSRSISNTDFQDITVSGASLSGTSLGNCGGCTNITFTTAVTRYARIAGNWSSTSTWATANTGGTTPASVPLPQDTVFFGSGAGAGTYTIDMARVPGFDCTGFTRTLAFSTAIEVYGGVTIPSGMTLTSSGAVTFLGRGSHTISSTPQLTSGNTTFSSVGGTYTLGADFSIGGNLTLDYGTLTASTFNVQAAKVLPTGTNTRTLNMGSGTWTLTGTGTGTNTIWNATETTGLTINTQTANIVLSNNTTLERSFNGGTFSYNRLTIGGNTATSTTSFGGGSTFAEIASTKTVAHTINFTANTQTTIGKWTVSGTAGNLVTVGSSSTPAVTLTFTGVQDPINYLSVSRVTANPNWFVGPDSADGGNNTRVFFSPPPSGNGLFFGSNF